MTETSRSAWGVGLATLTDDGRMLDTWYSALGLGPLPSDHRGPYGVPADLASLAATDTARGVHQEIVRTEIDLDAAPANTADAYLRLHLLSHRFVAPFEVSLEGLLDALPLNVWTSAGPCSPDNFDEVRLQLRIAAKGAPVAVRAVAKIPPMVDYVLPGEVAIADAARVRLGAYLAPGTKVTHEGFVDANAGTSGAARIQGRVSQGVIVGEGSHIGGSASLLPSEGAEPITIGSGCLVGANAGVGISLGDRCVVEAGLFLTPGTKVTVRTAEHPHRRVLSAHDLAGVSGMLFRRNSTTGIVEAFDRGAAE